MLRCRFGRGSAAAVGEPSRLRPPPGGEGSGGGSALLGGGVVAREAAGRCRPTALPVGACSLVACRAAPRASPQRAPGSAAGAALPRCIMCRRGAELPRPTPCGAEGWVRAAPAVPRPHKQRELLPEPAGQSQPSLGRRRGMVPAGSREQWQRPGTGAALVSASPLRHFLSLFF